MIATIEEIDINTPIQVYSNSYPCKEGGKFCLPPCNFRINAFKCDDKWEDHDGAGVVIFDDNDDDIKCTVIESGNYIGRCDSS